MGTEPRSARAGFVLPTTLLVTTMLTVILTAAFVMASAEFRATDNSLANARALALAEAGLQTYWADSRGLDTGDTYDSTTYALTGGYANVVARRLRASDGSTESLWLVRSHGFATDPVLSGQTSGQRVVAQLARFNGGSFPASAALIALNPVVVRGTSGLNPIDGNAPGGCPGANYPGLLHVQGTYDPEGPMSGSNLPYGNPRLDSLPSISAVYDSSHIDWERVLAGNLTADYQVPSWPSSYASYPLGVNYGDLTLSFPGTRSGILVVTGNLRFTAGRWRGIIIVGGFLVLTSNQGVDGTVITGLNDYAGTATVQADTLFRGGGGGDVQWHSCRVATAAAALSNLQPVAGGWIDTWSLY